MTAALLVAIPEAIAKGLSADHSVLQVLWARYAFLLAAMLLVTAHRRWPRRARGTQMTLQVIRVAPQIGCVTSFLLALRCLPLGSATALLWSPSGLVGRA